jgi:hypothetical protein
MSVAAMIAGRAAGHAAWVNATYGYGLVILALAAFAMRDAMAARAAA